MNDAKWIKWAKLTGLALLIAAAVWFLFQPMDAKAADLGGNCCADLEERIAELEATVARRGNRKMSLKVYGEINKNLRVIDTDPVTGTYSVDGVVVASGEVAPSYKAEDIVDGSTSPSFVGFAGEAGFANDWKAGYVLEIGVGGFDDGGTNEIYTNRAFVFVGGPIGRLALGHTSQASDGIDEIDLSNAGVARRPLSGRPLVGPQTGEALDLFDGTRADVIRYDSPVVGGFFASASWASGNEGGDVWDAALRYAGEFQDFRLAAGVAYRQGLVINNGGGSFTIDEDALDVQVWSAAVSAMHIPSGLFVTGNYGSLEGDVLQGAGLPYAIGLDGDGWAVTAGIERKLTTLGKTTFYGEYGDLTADATSDQSILCGGLCSSYEEHAGVEVTYWGGGVVQNIESAATDVYASVRFYEIGAGEGSSCGGCLGFTSEQFDIDTEAIVGTVGARVKF